MAQRSYIKVQRIPDAPNSRRDRRPSPADINAHPDPVTLLELMGDSLLSAMAQHQGGDWDILSLDDHPEAFYPTPGRCLWTWDDLLKADPDAVDPAPLLNLALRPSSSYPSHLQSVTPRFCKLMTGMRYAELSRCLKWLTDVDVLPSAPDSNDVIKALTLQGYGQLIDQEFDLNTERRTHSAPRNSRMTAAQHYVLKYGPPLATLAEATVVVPPAPADLIPDLDSRFDRAVEFLANRARDADLNHPDLDNTAKETICYVRNHHLYHFRHEVQERYLRSTWDTYRMNDADLSTPDRVVCALLRAMVQVDKRRRPINFQSAFGAPLLAGISPACVVREAMYVLSRTGSSFLEERHIMDMIDLIRGLPRARSSQAQANRDDLVTELNHLQVDFVAIRDRLPPSLADDMWRAQHSIAIPLWGLYGELD